MSKEFQEEGPRALVTIEIVLNASAIYCKIMNCIFPYTLLTWRLYNKLSHSL
jgi:hypothetical protein